MSDLAMNRLPMRLGSGVPVFADDFKKVKESWRRLLDLGVTTIYPAHGGPFPADAIRKAIDK